MSKSIPQFLINNVSINQFIKMNIILSVGFMSFSNSTLMAKMSSSSRVSMSGARAPQVPKHDIDLTEIIKTLKKTNKNPNEEKPSRLEWAVFAKDVIGLNKISVHGSTNPDQVSTSHIIYEIKNKIASEVWTPIKDIKKLKEWEPQLQSKFSNDIFNLAWLQFQLNDTESAKEMLQPLFVDEYNRMMKLEVVIRGFGGSPMDHISKLERVLSSLSDAKEKSEIQKKIKQVKIHISNLPESHVVT